MTNKKRIPGRCVVCSDRIPLQDDYCDSCYDLATAGRRVEKGHGIIVFPANTDRLSVRSY